jgi:hypothetical protein
MSVTSRQLAKNTAGQKRGQPEPAQMPKDIQQQHLFTTAEIADLVDDLARHAEAVCRHYLSNGRRAGNHWLVGDKANTPGRSLYVRLKANGRGAAGKWTDAATDEHGDLLDLIRETCGLTTFPDVVAEALRFLGLPHEKIRPRLVRVNADLQPRDVAPHDDWSSDDTLEPYDSVEAARRLFAASRPIAGTLAEAYLRRRGITDLAGTDALRFHPRCFYRIDRRDRDRHQHRSPDAGYDRHDVSHDIIAAAATCTLPALIAAVTDLDGNLTGVQRTFLDAQALSADAPNCILLGKAPVSSPRRALGDLLGHGVRIGPAGFGLTAEVMAAGEGVETMLSLRMCLTKMPIIAALSAAHLAAIQLPPALKRLYIAQDNDPSGRESAAKLKARAEAAGIEAIVLAPMLDDFNGDLRRFGQHALAQHLRPQLAPHDVVRFILLQD